MPRLAAADARRVRDLAGSLRTLVDGGPSGLETVLPEIAELIGAEKAIAYGFVPLEDSLELEFWHQVGLPADGRAVVSGWLEGKTIGWTTWNPFRPEPAHRNVTYGLRDVERISGSVLNYSVTREVYPKFGVAEHDQLRVLLCDGASMLAYLGGWRAEPFAARERRLLQALVPALKRRLKIERLLGQSELAMTALGAALEQVPAAAFVVHGANGSVLHANAAGQVLLARDRRSVTERLRAAKRGHAPGSFTLTRLAGAGMAEHFLAVERAPQGNFAGRMSGALRRWQLTPRQGEVLSLVAAGSTNRRAAAELGCAESTIELHVTSLLVKSGSESRAELVAKFWSDPS